MTTERSPIRLAGSDLQGSCHVCAFFHSKDEQYDVLMPFIKEGLDRGDRAFHIVDPKLHSNHVQRMEKSGINVTGAESTGQLEIRRWEEAHLQGNCFDQYRMIETVKEAQSKKQAHEIIRFVGNMEWALEDLPGVHDILEYESRLNYFLPQHRDAVICCYDLSRFDASLVMDIMRTHPKVIIGGILQENPFYVPPEEMLRELKERVSERN